LDNGSARNDASTLFSHHCFLEPLVSLYLDPMAAQLFNWSADDLFNLLEVPLCFF
jgi:hypothetical protein